MISLIVGVNPYVQLMIKQIDWPIVNLVSEDILSLWGHFILLINFQSGIILPIAPL